MINEELYFLFAKLPEYLGGHILLSLAALAVGLIVSVPLGVLASRRPKLAEYILGTAGILQTVPTLALLAAPAGETESDIVARAQLLRCHQDCIQRMAGTVIAGVHDDEFRRQIVRAPKLFPALFVETNCVVMRPWRKDVDLVCRNSPGRDPLPHESIEYDDSFRTSHAALEQRAQQFRCQGIWFEPARGDRLVRIQIHYPENHPAALKPSEPSRQPRNQGRRSQRHYGVLSRQDAQAKRAGDRKAGKVQSAAEARFLVRADRPHPNNPDVVPALAPGKTQLLIVIAAIAANNCHVVPALDQARRQIVELLRRRNHVRPKTLVE